METTLPNKGIETSMNTQWELYAEVDMNAESDLDSEMDLYIKLPYT